MKRNAIRNVLIAAAVLVLAFCAACGEPPGSSSPGDTLWRPGAAVIPMQPVAPGSFRLGQSLGAGGGFPELRVTEVTLTWGFYMGRYPITREQWITVLAGNPNGIPVPHPDWSDSPANTQENAAAGGFDINRRPVTHVSWYDAIVFANWLSIANGLLPAYEIQCASNNQWTTDPARWGAVPTTSDSPLRPRWDNVRIAPGSDGYRLPTEAQWEFAAKGGVTGETFTFSGSDTANDVAWIMTNSGNSPRMVGLLDANGLDIHDMSGNVREWTQSWWADSHPGGTLFDPPGAASGSNRVVRGGNWANSPSFTRSVSRGWNYPSVRRDFEGFRLVRPSDTPGSPPLGVISISAQPEAMTVVHHGSIIGDLTVTASVTGEGTPSFRWYHSAENSNSGGTFTGWISNTFTIPDDLDVGTHFFYVVVSATGAVPLASNVAVVRVLGVMPMQWVQHGTFTLGQNLGTWGGGNVSNLTQVTLTQGFWMGRYPVTRQQWIDVMGVGILGWSTAAANPQESAAGGDMNRRPATHVSWYHAMMFANRLSDAHGLSPAYEIRCATNSQWTTDPARWGTVPTIPYPRWNAARIVPSSNGYRLPTEAQWEFAAKGGNTADSYTFSGGDNPALVAWTSANSNGSPRMVGLLNANGLGLHDMSGNVWEWTQSRFTASHPGGSQVDWTGPAGSERVLRGGSMSGGANEARSVVRLRFDPFPAVNSGFRLVRPAP